MRGEKANLFLNATSPRVGLLRQSEQNIDKNSTFAPHNQPRRCSSSFESGKPINMGTSACVTAWVGSCNSLVTAWLQHG
eukprot:366000-Chlamydomonas_euryale.AAC.21